MFHLLLMLYLPFSVLHLQSVAPQLWSQQNSAFREDIRWPQMVSLIDKTALLFPLQQWSYLETATRSQAEEDLKEDRCSASWRDPSAASELGKKIQHFKVCQEGKLQVKGQRGSLGQTIEMRSIHACCGAGPESLLWRSDLMTGLSVPMK